MNWLLAHAHPREGDDFAAERAEVHVLGVGKVAAAATLTRVLAGAVAQGRLPDAVLLFGVCGAYPARHRRGGPVLRVGEACVVGDDVLADEGAATEEGFLDLEDLELGRVGPFTTDPSLVARAAERLGVPVVRGATVSTCSGTEALSGERARRTGAAVETMEGAAVAAVCRRFAVPWLQVRAVSNETGDRQRAGWRLAEAVTAVQDAVRRVVERA